MIFIRIVYPYYLIWNVDDAFNPQKSRDDVQTSIEEDRAAGSRTVLSVSKTEEKNRRW